MLLNKVQGLLQVQMQHFLQLAGHRDVAVLLLLRGLGCLLSLGLVARSLFLLAGLLRVIAAALLLHLVPFLAALFHTILELLHDLGSSTGKGLKDTLEHSESRSETAAISLTLASPLSKERTATSSHLTGSPYLQEFVRMFLVSFTFLAEVKVRTS